MGSPMGLVGNLHAWRAGCRGMSDRTYKIIELVGISDDSFSDAVDNAIAKANETLSGLAWFEVEEERGAIGDGGVTEYQVKVKVAFKLS